MPRDVHRRLRHAAWKGDAKLARSMLKRGASIEAADSDGYTPLLIAARWGRAKMVALLVEKHNASLASRNSSGDNAYAA